MRLITSILLNGLLVYAGGWLLSGVSVDGFVVAIIAAIVLGLVNFLVKPLLTLLTLPLTIVTFGLFLLVVNGLSVLLASAMVPGFAVDGLFWAILFSVVLAIGNLLIGDRSREPKE